MSEHAEKIQELWRSAASAYDRACLGGNAYNAARAGGWLNGIEEVAAALGVEVGGKDSACTCNGQWTCCACQECAGCSECESGPTTEDGA